MSLDNNKELIAQSLKLSKRLSLINLITTTLICSGPPLWLIVRILDNETEKLLITALLTIPALIYMTFRWCSYYYTQKYGE